MRYMKYALVAGAAALLAGCTTTHYEDRDAVGRTYVDPEVYYGSTYYAPRTYHGYRGSPIDGLNRGVNTNWFGPIYSGANAAMGVGTPSGTYDHAR